MKSSLTNKLNLLYSFQEQFCDPNVEVCCKQTKGSVNSNIVLPNIIGKSVPSSINELLSSDKSSETGSSFKFTGGAGFSSGNVQVSSIFDFSQLWLG